MCKEIQPFISLDKAKINTKRLFTRKWNEFGNYVKYEIGNKQYKKFIKVQKPELIWSKFGFITAGRTNFTDNIIEMNINYLYSPDYKKFLKSTIIHETAHALAGSLFNDFGHGKFWKYIDLLLNDNGEIYCDFAAPINQPMKNRMKFICSCGTEHVVSKKMGKSILDGMYICKDCSRNLSKAKRVA